MGYYLQEPYALRAIVGPSRERRILQMYQEKTIQSRRVYGGKIVNVRQDTVELEPGQIAVREVVEHSDSVAIVPVDEKDNVLLVRQYRKAVGKTLLEVPAGGIKEGEDPERGVLRELREETGYTAGKIQRLGGFYASPGFCTEYLHLYLATQLTPDPLPMDVDERIEVVSIPFKRIPELIAAGEIEDSKSLAGLLTVLLCRSSSPGRLQ